MPTLYVFRGSPMDYTHYLLKKIWIRNIHHRGGFIAHEDFAAEVRERTKSVFRELVESGILEETPDGYRLIVNGADYLAVMGVMDG